MPRATLRKASSPSPYRFGDGVLSRSSMIRPFLPRTGRLPSGAKGGRWWPEDGRGGWTRGSRPRAELATRMSGSDSAALALFAIYALTVASWLFGGLAPVLNASFPTVLATFSEWWKAAAPWLPCREESSRPPIRGSRGRDRGHARPSSASRTRAPCGPNVAPSIRARLEKGADQDLWLVDQRGIEPLTSPVRGVRSTN